jgi:electron transport complex protein RnfG
MTQDETKPVEAASADEPVHAEVAPARLVLTLAIAGLLAGLLLVVVFQATEPTILAYKAKVLKAAVQVVLGEPDHYDTLYLYEGALTSQLAEDVQTRDLERVFLGYDADGKRVGFALASAEPGFQDLVKVIFGYDAETKQLLGMRVLENKETPGLGDKIVKDLDFVSAFDGVATPIVGIKPGRASGDPAEVDMITGATISSKAVIRIINNALERLGPPMDRYAGDDKGGASK